MLQIQGTIVGDLLPLARTETPPVNIREAYDWLCQRLPGNIYLSLTKQESLSGDVHGRSPRDGWKTSYTVYASAWDHARQKDALLWSDSVTGDTWHAACVALLAAYRQKFPGFVPTPSGTTASTLNVTSTHDVGASHAA